MRAFLFVLLLVSVFTFHSEISCADAAVRVVAPHSHEPSNEIRELEQKNESLRYERDIAQIKAELIDAQTSWFEILISFLTAGFGLIVTVAVIFFTIRFGKAAVDEAKNAISDERDEIHTMLDTARSLLREIEEHRTTAAELLEGTSPGEPPENPGKQQSLREIAAAARLKPRGERSADDFLALVTVSSMDQNWAEMERLASVMAYLFEGDDEVRAYALFGKGIALDNLKRYAESASAYNELLKDFGDSDSAALKNLVAQSLVNLGGALDKMDLRDEAIAAYDEVVRRFGDADSKVLQEQVAFALNNKGVALNEQGKTDDVIAVYDDVVRRFGDTDVEKLQEIVARTLASKGLAMDKLESPVAEIAAYDEVISRFGDAESEILRQVVSMTLLNKGLALGRLGRPEDEIAIYDDIVKKFGDDIATDIRKQVGFSLINKGISLSKIGNNDDAVEVFNEVLRRFLDAEDVSLKEVVAKALTYKGVALVNLDRADDGIAAYDEVVRLFGDADAESLQEVAAAARFNKACAWALKSDVAETILALEQWRDAIGSFNCASVSSDSDFDHVRDDQAFQAFLRKNGCP